MFSCICRWGFVSPHGEDSDFFQNERYNYRIEMYPDKFAYRVYYKPDHFIRFSAVDFNIYFNGKEEK